MSDLLIMETGNGGDLVLTGNDLEMVNGYENLPYMEMFGGSNWWGNEFLEPLQQFDCKTEIALRDNALDSAGRLEIEKAIKLDLQIISDNVPGTVITVDTQIVTDDKLSIVITINGKAFSYLWEPSKRFLTYKV